MTHRVRGSAPEGAREDGVVARDRPVRIHAEDLAVQRVRVLREGRVADLAHRHPELAIGSEPHPAPVVVAAREHPGPDHVAIEREAAVRLAIPQDLIQPSVVVPRRTDVDEVVGDEGRVEGDAHRAGLALGVDVRDWVVRELRRTRSAARVDQDVAGPLGDEHPAVGRKGDVPGEAEPRLDHGRREVRSGPRSDGNARDRDRKEDPLSFHPPLAVHVRAQVERVAPQ